MAAAFASDRPDTIVGQWVIEVEDSTAVIREMTEDGWYTAKFIVPRGGKPGDTIMIARVRLGERGVFIRHGGDLQQLQQDVQMTQDLLWQIKAKMDSAEKKP
jgi:hypothetical protein